MALIPHQLKSPPKYLLASILCSANGLLFGMDTGIIGPATDMKYFKSAFGGSENSTIHGLIVSCILIPAALSSFFAGHLADRCGRVKGISIGTFIFGVGAAIEAGSISLAMFIVGRIIEGIGEGLFLGNLVVFICEISPITIRGALTTGPQLACTLGLVLGYFTSYGTSGMQSSVSWRMPWIILAAFSMIICAFSLACLPETPQWLGLQGRVQEAEEVWDKLGVTSADREKVELQVQTREKKVAKLLDIFSKDVRGRTALAVFLMGMQQMSGIDGVLYVRSQHQHTYPISSEPSPANQQLTVRPTTIPKRRARLVRSELSSLGRVSARHLRSHDPGPLLRRQMGPANEHYIRRTRDGDPDVRDGRPVRRRRRAQAKRRGSLGRDRGHLSLRRAVFRDLGHNGQGIRGGDPAAAHASVGDHAVPFE